MTPCKHLFGGKRLHTERGEETRRTNCLLTKEKHFQMAAGAALVVAREQRGAVVPFGALEALAPPALDVPTIPAQVRLLCEHLARHRANDIAGQARAARVARGGLAGARLSAAEFNEAARVVEKARARAVAPREDATSRDITPAR